MIVQVILLSGRSDVEHLKIHGIPHAHIDGDNLDMVYPEEEGPDLLLLNLESMFGNYYRRRGMQQTHPIRELQWLWSMNLSKILSKLSSKILSNSRGRENLLLISGVHFEATDNTASERLRKREIGSLLDHHLASGLRMASVLENEVGGWACRISTDGRTVKDIAAQILEQANWV
ncbi:uncharacterized protein P174DRAFT_516621 [Aspergillus novofumigatus IBT 16806]|uniref:Uncharacterized protein n=1 Tax=Aspergillus novofumigatus (strain IBT 16806) TaxID=1392255 RepID=A0A2I1BS93_ASPN1|nr:uncharacterized protein P174DRAFT_516621 [Aspergillus novofumigatus IBT 16806]PKX88253.1 hypothetical protein P174DRAFT_516621 [Aspergillus novofumigatus IBT 16806]